MGRYKYTPLEDSTSIRLVTILPGKFDDAMRVEIKHESLVTPSKVESTRLSLKEIRETLPKGWDAEETVEGRVIFWNWETISTTWIHPDLNIDRALYDPIPNTEANSSVPAYEALSYAWGTPEKDEMAKVTATNIKGEPLHSSVRQARRLPITRSLSGALRYLRYADLSRTMWIDAICIDQNNDQERSKQVQRMGQIFSLAGRVVAWLGPSFPDNRLALATLRRIGEQVEISRDNYRLPAPLCSHPDWYDNETRLPFVMNEFAAITQLCELEYFTRLWVVQELHLGSAKSIIKCGNEEIPWPLFRRAIICIEEKDQGIPTKLRKSIDPIYTISFVINNQTMHNIIYTFHNRECADGRDKVYGLMNLLDRAVSKHIVVDYSRPAMDAFKQVFLAFLGQEQRLAQLPFAGLRYLPVSTKTSSAWPTWLPNWSQFVQISVPLNLGPCASGISAARAKYIPPDRLEITGLYFATVSTVHQRLPSRDEGFLGIVEMLKGLDLENSQASNYPTSETLLNAYLQTIVLGRVEERAAEQGYPTLSEIREEVTRLAAHPESTDQPKLSDYYRDNIVSWVADMCIFETSNGYVGILQGNPHPGDEVFVILGCDVPVLLRPTSSGEYEVVGDCYLHGIMDGEALLGALPPAWSAQLVPTADGVDRRLFRNADTNITTSEDPRLVNLSIPAEWESIEFEWTPADPIYCKKFRNTNTGEFINSDPRLFPEALIERGVPLKTITLV
ncbi:HET-domain-containing protein [Xylariaceae sp. AK1471]|nr:HET-domain-containing protein [Xylariaceae sp. AK1471]